MHIDNNYAINKMSKIFVENSANKKIRLKQLKIS